MVVITDVANYVSIWY